MATAKKNVAASSKANEIKGNKMLSKKMETALNAQIVHETFSAYLYISMSAWLESSGYLGSAHWMNIQAKEELSHATKLYRFILERGGQVRLGAIEAPQAKWASPLAVFQDAYAHEQKVTALIHNLTGIARAENDYASEIFLQWFITEQVEEESSVSEIIRQLEISGGDKGPGIYMIDKDLLTRTLTVEAQTILAI